MAITMSQAPQYFVKVSSLVFQVRTDLISGFRVHRDAYGESFEWSKIVCGELGIIAKAASIEKRQRRAVKITWGLFLNFLVSLEDSQQGNLQDSL